MARTSVRGRLKFAQILRVAHRAPSVHPYFPPRFAIQAHAVSCLSSLRRPLCLRAATMKQLALDIGLATGPTLARFFAGPNEAALQHLQLWVGEGSQQDTRSPVPTYLWGEAGSGKTHLLKAVHRALSDQGASVGWLDASVAMPAEFDERWAAVVLDDVHLYSTAQQAMAFNWFVNAASPANGAPRWVLAAGNLPPADLPLRDDLRSRLGWGHVYQLQLLDETARRAVLRQEADARGVFLGDEVMDFMLNRFSRDLGSLMQLLDQLDAYALRTQRAITIPLLKAMLESE
jgi:DnaA family protein